MHLSATIANSLWCASNVPAYLRFLRALREPQAIQEHKLRVYLEQNAHTDFGKAHHFDTIRSYKDFARRLPLARYDAFEPWIGRIRRGETNVLTSEPVTHLVPTSGSTGARKLIPFTAGLQREINAAIGPWLVDLVRQQPGILGGRAYWSVTPAMRGTEYEESVVPIGFDADTAYLGGARRRFVDRIMAVPAEVQHAESLETFRYQTLLHLLRCRDLRLISVWHPSFLTLLLDSLPEFRERLIKASPGRARELRAANPREPESLWPGLRIISCWGDAAAATGLADLRRRFPNTVVLAKGLIATEAFVTLPFAACYPLAVRSHFFEFIDDAGRVHPVESVREGGEYEIVITTAGGLWRYQTGDQVAVTGWMEKTPSVRFLGRGGDVSDRFGEKLSEAFVVRALREVFNGNAPRFALLAPDEDDAGCCYTLFVEGEAQWHWAESLDRGLRANPHYAGCRDLGQLGAVRVFVVAKHGYGTFVRRLAANGARFGDIKPAVMSRLSGWSDEFEGTYLGHPNETLSLR